VTLLVYALIKAPDDGWGAARTIAELVAAVVLLILFIGNEALVARPLMPLRVVKLPGLAEANTVVLLAFGAVFALFFFLSLYLQEVLGYSALRAGMAFLPLALGIMLAAGATARLIERRGPRPPMIAGTLILTGGLLWLVRLPVHGHYVSDLLPPLLTVAVGAGSSLIACVMAANDGVQEHEAGLAAGLLNTFQRIGGSLALAVLSAVATAHTRTLATTGHLDPAQALIGGFHAAFVVAAGFAIAAFAVSAATSLRRRRTGADL
jgi:predicted MFS family arabinose efflux permease